MLYRLQKFLFYLCFFSSVWCVNASAENLLQIFQQAYQYDPQFHMKESVWHSHQQQAFVERSALLPTVEVKNEYRKYSGQNTAYQTDDNTSDSSIALSLSQPIFNVEHWLNYQGAQINSKAFKTEYAAALQDLMRRVTESYFDVLVAQKKLQINEYARDDYARLLKWTKARFDAGLVKAVDIDTVQASYEESFAAVIDARNFLLMQQAHLKTITGLREDNLTSLKDRTPLIKPSPLNLQTWISKVREKNLTVLANQYKLQASKTAMNAQHAGHYPTVSADLNRNYRRGNSIQEGNGHDTNIMLTLSVPIYAGGRVTAQTKEAAYDYQALLDQTEQDYRAQVEQVQNSYEGVVNGVERLQTDARIIAADKQALNSVNFAYKAGLSAINMDTMVNARQRLYQHQLNNFQNKRDYIVNLIKLKQAAGLLSIYDLVQLNSWLQN